MNLKDITRRSTPPKPWTEGDNIPWDDPEFGVRMLREHLSQQHDLASRRFSTIDRQTTWIHDRILVGSPSRILDLTCGPGLYTRRLSESGHQCTGIDFSSVALEYAALDAAAQGCACDYRLGDVRKAEFGGGYDLVMMLFGQFNVFQRNEARSILKRAFTALAPGGRVLIEIQRFDSVEEEGRRGSSWYSCGEGGGLFSGLPHLCLTESFWNPADCSTTKRFFIIDSETGEVTRHVMTSEAYTEEGIVDLLSGAGFADIRILPSLTGDQPDDEVQAAFIGVMGARPLSDSAGHPPCRGNHPISP